MFDAISHDKFRPLSFSCGSGVTGCIILVAAIIAGRSNVSLYDGSWSEWGSIPTLPVEL
jgi:thiosulfate/3-mercaptopyruvate sulfurtransferase